MFFLTSRISCLTLGRQQALLAKTIRASLSTAAASPKRFYKNVNIVKAGNDKFEIILDQRKLKTPKGAPFYVTNEVLANMIANEWSMQTEKIALNQMHLTSLTNTVLDNPNNLDSQMAAAKLVSFLESDTLCFRMPEPEELLKHQVANWDPVVQWFADNFRINVPVTSNMSIAPIQPEAKEHLLKHFLSYNFWSLNGLLYVCDNLKSIILTSALVFRRVSVEDAIELSRIEENFQANRWGKVEFHHDIEASNIQSRVAAALLFTLLNCDQIQSLAYHKNKQNN